MGKGVNGVLMGISVVFVLLLLVSPFAYNGENIGINENYLEIIVYGLLAMVFLGTLLICAMVIRLFGLLMSRKTIS